MADEENGESENLMKGDDEDSEAESGDGNEDDDGAHEKDRTEDGDGVADAGPSQPAHTGGAGEEDGVCGGTKEPLQGKASARDSAAVSTNTDTVHATTGAGPSAGVGDDVETQGETETPGSAVGGDAETSMETDAPTPDVKAAASAKSAFLVSSSVSDSSLPPRRDDDDIAAVAAAFPRAHSPGAASVRPTRVTPTSSTANIIATTAAAGKRRRVFIEDGDDDVVATALLASAPASAGTSAAGVDASEGGTLGKVAASAATTATNAAIADGEEDMEEHDDTQRGMRWTWHPLHRHPLERSVCGLVYPEHEGVGHCDACAAIIVPHEVRLGIFFLLLCFVRECM